MTDKTNSGTATMRPLWCVSAVLVLLSTFCLELGSGIRVEEAVGIDGIFRPHQGFRTKTRMCLACKLFQDLEQERAAARKEREKNEKLSEIRIGTNGVIEEIARRKRKKMALLTGDPSWGQGSRFVVLGHPTTMDVVQDAKDKALAVASSLPKGAREMVLRIVREKMAPVMPTKEIINPAWFPGVHHRIPKFIRVPIFDPSHGREAIAPIKKIPKFLSKGGAMAGAAAAAAAAVANGANPKQVEQQMKPEEEKNPHGGSKSLNDDDALPLSVKNDPKANWEKSPPSGNSKKITDALKAADRMKGMEIAKKAIRVAESFARNANAIMTGGSPVTQQELTVAPRDHTVEHVFLCTHAAVPMDCCICCQKLSDECCKFCQTHKNHSEPEPVEDRNDNSVNLSSDSSEVSKVLSKQENSDSSKPAQHHQKAPPNPAPKGKGGGKKTQPGAAPAKPSCRQYPQYKESYAKERIKCEGNVECPKTIVVTASHVTKSTSFKFVPTPETGQDLDFKLEITWCDDKSFDKSETVVRVRKHNDKAKTRPDHPKASRGGAKPKSPEKPKPAAKAKGTAVPIQSAQVSPESPSNTKSPQSKKKSASDIMGVKNPYSKSKPKKSKDKPGYQIVNEEDDCEKEYFQAHPMPRNDRIENGRDGRKVPEGWRCKNKTKAAVGGTVDAGDSNAPKPKSHVITIFPSKVDIGKICGGVGSRAAAACLAAKAARRSKIAALSAVEAAKKGDLFTAAKMLSAASMGMSGKGDEPDKKDDDSDDEDGDGGAGKGKGDEKGNGSGKGDGNGNGSGKGDGNGGNALEDVRQEEGHGSRKKGDSGGLSDLAGALPGALAGLDGDDLSGKKGGNSPCESKACSKKGGKGRTKCGKKGKAGKKKGGVGPVECKKAVKASKGNGFDPDLPSTPEIDKMMPKKEKDIIEEQKVLGPPFMGFISLVEQALDPEDEVKPIDRPENNVPKIEDSMDKTRNLDTRVRLDRVKRRQNRKRRPEEILRDIKNKFRMKNSPGDQVNDWEEAQGQVYKFAELIICINESSENLARTMLSTLLQNAKTKVSCLPWKANREFDPSNGYKYAADGR